MNHTWEYLKGEFAASPRDATVRRMSVPGGWLYQPLDGIVGNPDGNVVFVPLVEG